MSNRPITRVEEISELSEGDRKKLDIVCQHYRFRATSYYLSLIDWSNPKDPLRRIVVPDPEEMISWGRLDASEEQNYTVLPGLQHKYNSTALMLVSGDCACVCRYCFRKRIFMNGNSDALSDFDAAFDYINEHREITNALLSGGDPLRLSTARLDSIVTELGKIDHVRLTRIGTKMLSYDPLRILGDPDLFSMIEKHSASNRTIYVMTHFTHPREMTDLAMEAAQKLRKAGAILANQTPLLRGVNDNPQTLAELFRKLSFAGIPPYYIFQCRPASGNLPYSVPIEAGYTIFEKARSLVSGLGKRARFVMSHSTGKIEVVGMTDVFVYFKYHRAAEDLDTGKFMALRRNPDAYWFDDYQEMNHEDEIVTPASA